MTGPEPDPSPGKDDDPSSPCAPVLAGREAPVLTGREAVGALTGREAAGALAELLPTLRAYAIPLRNRFRGITVREGALIRGPAGWGEFCPFAEYGPVESARWLASAIESAVLGWPAPVRTSVGVNVTVPAVGPELA